MRKILTIGHSTLDVSRFIELLQLNQVTAVADVRSVPMSRHTPQFNRKTLQRDLKSENVSYVFLGAELGARSRDHSCYVGGKVQYGRLAQTDEFARGIDRLLKGAQRERIAVMCSEAEPLSCHRTVLVSKVLTERGVHVEHIHRNGHVEPHTTAMQRLLTHFGLDQADLFRSFTEILDEALRRQEAKIAYVDYELATNSNTI